jgi:hypothetical protein
MKFMYVTKCNTFIVLVDNDKMPKALQYPCSPNTNFKTQGHS